MTEHEPPTPTSSLHDAALPHDEGHLHPDLLPPSPEEAAHETVSSHATIAAHEHDDAFEAEQFSQDNLHQAEPETAHEPLDGEASSTEPLLLEPPLLEPVERPRVVPDVLIEEPMAPPSDHSGDPSPPSHYAEPPNQEASRRQRRDPLPWLFGMFIILLIGAVVYLWRHPINGLSANAAPDEHIVALQDQVTALQQRLATLEQRPAPPPPPAPDLSPVVAPLEKRLTALEQRPAPASGPADATNSAVSQTIRDLTAKLDALSKQQSQLAAGQTASAASLAARIDAEQKSLANLTAQSSQITALTNRLEAEERQVGALSAQAGQVSMLAGRLDAQEKQLGTISGQAGQISSVAGRLDAQEKQVGVLATEASKINGVAERAARTARIQAATAALEAGRPLGDVPDAPPALTKFRTEAPPTEAALRLAFPTAAAAALAASRPDTAHLPFWEAVQSRAQELITVRRGDEVIVGDPAAGVIARARHALDAGDLAGATSALHELTGAPAAAFASWTQRAQALLDARAALATLAAHA